ncbi:MULTISPECIES: hypothetical protein [Rahnella]|jgi:hypothetical protein|nr:MULTISPECIES: hypothetical protein [Rahnella]
MNLIIQIGSLTGSATKCSTVYGFITPLSSLEWAQQNFFTQNPAISGVE